MRLWRRGRNAAEPPGEREPDPEFGFLTVGQASRLRALAHRTFAEAGVEVVVRPGHLEAADGRVFGLGNLAATCLQVLSDGGEKAWPEVVRRHASVVLASPRMDVLLSELPREEVLRRVYLRLVGTSTLPDEAWAWYRYARPVAGDLVELLAFDEPETVRMLRDEDVANLGVGDLRAAGLENLLRDRYDAHEVVRGPLGQHFHLVLGDSVYTASKLLVLPDVLSRTVGEREPEHGVLVAVPHRHQLAFAVVDAPTLTATVQTLTGFAAARYEDGIGPVSPYLYWWHHGRLTQVSVLDGEGRLCVDATGPFGDLLRRLGLPPQP